MAFQRGLSGSMSVAGGTALGQLVGWTFQSAVEVLDTTVSGDAWKSSIGGVANWSATGRCKLDGADAGQAALLTALLNATPASVTAAIVLKINGSTKAISGGALVKDCNIASQLGSIVELNVSFEGSGPATYVWS